MAGLVQYRGKYYARVHFKVDGKVKEKLVGLKTCDREKALRIRTRINELEALYKQGLIQLDQVCVDSISNFDELQHEFEEYLETKNDSPATIALYRHALGHLKIFLDGKDIKILNKTDYIPFMEYMKKNYSNPVTLNLRLRSIRALLFWLVEFEKINKLPFKIKLVPTVKKKPRYFTNKELTKIFKKIESDENDELLARVKLHLNTGMRLGEFNNSYLEDGFIHIYHTKSKKERTIPVSAETAFYYKYCKENGKISSESISRLFKETLKNLGYENTPSGDRRCFHCLRHTFAIRTWYQIRDIYSVCKLLGHYSVIMTEIYAEFNIKQLARDFGENDRRSQPVYHQVNYFSRSISKQLSDY